MICAARSALNCSISELSRPRSRNTLPLPRTNSSLSSFIGAESLPIRIVAGWNNAKADGPLEPISVRRLRLFRMLGLWVLRLLRGQDGGLKPEILDGFDHVHEVVQAHGFADVAVRVQAVGLLYVSGCSGCGHHQHGNAFQIGIGLDLGQNLGP